MLPVSMPKANGSDPGKMYVRRIRMSNKRTANATIVAIAYGCRRHQPNCRMEFEDVTMPLCAPILTGLARRHNQNPAGPRFPLAVRLLPLLAIRAARRLRLVLHQRKLQFALRSIDPVEPHFHAVSQRKNLLR